ncbi:MAG: nickel import ATP-binding protein NikD [Dethiosulfovibrio peptidovorans]|nr:MAG: nickel import ATP-binding protein NikD [Dethiosulfovibrio peptidovorans]
MSAHLLTARELSIETTTNSPLSLVRDVSFSVHPGEVTCLVGESGSGKSLSCMAALSLLPRGVRRTSGTVTFQDRVLDELSPRELQTLRGGRIAVVLQNPSSCFDPVFSIGTHFDETMVAHGGQTSLGRDDRIATALGEVGLDDWAEICRAYPFQLSGGMLQRVMLALALINDPVLLVADEPTTDLDTISQKRVLDLIDEARERRGMGVLLVTHDLGVVARMAHHVVVLDQGSLIESGPVRQIFEQPQHPTTQALVSTHKHLSSNLNFKEARS